MSCQEGRNYFSLYGIDKLQVMNTLFLELGGWCTKILCFGMKESVEIALSALKNYANLVDVQETIDACQYGKTKTGGGVGGEKTFKTF